MLFSFPRGVLDETLNLIESVSEGFPSYFSIPKFITWLNGQQRQLYMKHNHRQSDRHIKCYSIPKLRSIHQTVQKLEKGLS